MRVHLVIGVEREERNARRDVLLQDRREPFFELIAAADVVHVSEVDRLAGRDPADVLGDVSRVVVAGAPVRAHGHRRLAPPSHQRIHEAGLQRSCGSERPAWDARGETPARRRRSVPTRPHPPGSRSCAASGRSGSPCCRIRRIDARAAVRTPRRSDSPATVRARPRAPGATLQPRRGVWRARRASETAQAPRAPSP